MARCRLQQIVSFKVCKVWIYLDLKKCPLFHRPIDVSQSFYAPNSDWTFVAYRSDHIWLLDKSCQLDGERQRGIIINHAQHRLFHGPGIGVAMAASFVLWFSDQWTDSNAKRRYSASQPEMCAIDPNSKM